MISFCTYNNLVKTTKLPSPHLQNQPLNKKKKKKKNYPRKQIGYQTVGMSSITSMALILSRWKLMTGTEDGLLMGNGSRLTSSRVGE